MRVTRRGFIKRALAVGALALVPFLPKMPGVTRASIPVSLGRGSTWPWVHEFNWGIKAADIRRRIAEIEREEWYCVGCDRLFPNRVMAKAVQSDDEDGVLLCPACYSEAEAYLDLAAQLLGS